MFQFNEARHAFAERAIKSDQLAFFLQFSGVYTLYDHNGYLVYIGSTERTLKIRLLEHRRDCEQLGIKYAQYFSFEIHSGNPKHREEELLLKYQLKYGKLPLENDRIG